LKEILKSWQNRLRYKGVILEDTGYNIWGSSPIWGDDGKVHLFASRIPKNPGFYYWWATSQIAHYVSDDPAGPFRFVDVLLKPGDSRPALRQSVLRPGQARFRMAQALQTGKAISPSWQRESGGRHA